MLLSDAIVRSAVFRAWQGVVDDCRIEVDQALIDQALIDQVLA
jgi:hypothetical protein